MGIFEGRYISSFRLSISVSSAKIVQVLKKLRVTETETLAWPKSRLSGH